MTRTGFHFLRLGALVVGFSASLAYAGIEAERSEGGPIVGMLNSDSIMFADAYRRILAEKIAKDPGYAGRFPSKRWSKVGFNTHSATVARMDYTFTKDGHEQKRTYHARSGPAMDVFLSRVDDRAPPPKSGDSSGGESAASSGGESAASSEYKVTGEDIAVDMAEFKYYPADTAQHVRVPNLPEGKIIHVTEVKGKLKHHSDAELKIFRQIEKDITDGIATTGGTLTGYVSQAVCESCEAAAGVLSEKLGIDGKIYFLAEKAGVAKPGEQKAASTELKDLRKEYARDQFQSRRITRPGDPSWSSRDAVTRIEAEEAGTAVAEPCAD